LNSNSLKNNNKLDHVAILSFVSIMQICSWLWDAAAANKDHVGDFILEAALLRLLFLFSRVTTAWQPHLSMYGCSIISL
jgi:hypothetical protein